jgi:hypothetical protein
MSADEESRVSASELREAVWELIGHRAHPGATKEQLFDMLEYKDVNIGQSPVNVMRKELMAYIASNNGRLSMWCDGNCFAHSDLIVVSCHRQLLSELEEQEDDPCLK